MANPENLIGHEFTSDQNREEAAKNGRKGGRASGEARRRRKAMRECFEEYLKQEFTNHDGKKVTGVELICMKQFRNAVDGDHKAFQTIRDQIGEMPAQRIEVDTIDQQTYDRIEKLLSED